MAAILVSAIVHVIVLILLARHAGQAFSRQEAPTIEVALIAPSRPVVQRRHVERVSQTQGVDAPSPVAVPAVAAPAPAGVAAPIERAPAADERPALRGLRGGCDPDRMTRQEQEDCEARRWAGPRPAAPKLNLDPTGRYVENPEPFLSRRPEKGCRARLTGDVDPMGNDSNARAGVTCVKRF